MTVTLRPYQQQLLADIRAAMRVEGHRRILAVMPTGAGKGCTIAEMVRTAAAKGHRSLILVHRSELVNDLSARITSLGIRHGVIAAGRSMDLSLPTQVASVQTIVRRLHKIPPPSLIIQDEAHHLIQGNTWGKVIDAWPRAFLIGKTATPLRLDGRGLGEGQGGYFTKLVLGPSAEWLTDNGYLAPARVLAPPGFDAGGIHRRMGEFDMREAEQRLGSALMGDAVSHYRQHLAGQTAIAFCCSLAHAEAVAESFRSRGIAAASIDGSMSGPERARLLADLGTGALKVLTSCALIGEGIDVPSVAGAILLRPTMSLALYLQMVGRALRPQEGKTAVILDHAGNAHRHGLPTDPREWSLEGLSKRQREAAPSVKVCPACFSAISSRLQTCPECGHAFQPERRQLEHVEGQLQELQRQAAKRDRKREQSEARTLDQLVTLGRQRGMKNPRAWAQHVLAGRQAKGQWGRVA
jgi:superfamily II DNA or RNA helicase